MFELWVIIEGNGEGELLLVDVRAKEDLPPQVRRRVRRVGSGPFPTEVEATRFRQKYRMERDATVTAAASVNPRRTTDGQHADGAILPRCLTEVHSLASGSAVE